MEDLSIKNTKNKEGSDFIMDDQIKFEDLLKNKTRLQIFFLLFFYEELNVSDIAQKIHTSKATVSRHLDAMEKDNILESRISEFKRSITPRYYRLPIEKMMKILPFESRSMRNIPKDPESRLIYYKNALNVIRSNLFLIQEGLGLLNPMLNGLENRLTSIENADKVFTDYFSSELEKKIDFQTIVISENILPEYYQLWLKFRKDVEKLEKQKKGDHSYMVFETVLPFKEMVEFKEREENPNQNH
jgi:predicted transcriptional regulator